MVLCDMVWCVIWHVMCVLCDDLSLCGCTHFSSDDGILDSLSYIVSLATLKKEVQALRSETYSEDNTEHKRILLEVTSRKTIARGIHRSVSDPPTAMGPADALCSIEITHHQTVAGNRIPGY